MPAEPHAIIVMGVAGSGKSTLALALARHYGYEFLDADDFHAVDAKVQMARGVPLTDAQRDPWVELLRCALRANAQQGRSTVMAFSGLRADHRQRLRDSGVPMRFVFLHARSAVIAARLAARWDHFMPGDLLASQLDALQAPIAEPDVIAVEVSGSPGLILKRVIAALETA